MHRINISLENEQYELLVGEARRRGVSLAAIVRELVIASMQNSKPARKRDSDPLARITGVGAGTGEPVGRQQNRFLYGKKRPSRSHAACASRRAGW